jgi:hypothetical protein
MGGWSKILLMSIPASSQVEARIKGPDPSRIHAEELTDCDGREYLGLPCVTTWVAARNIRGTSTIHRVMQPEGAEALGLQSFPRGDALTKKPAR